MTSTLVFEGDGRVEEYVGGYDDWMRQKGKEAEGQGPEAQGPTAGEDRPAADQRAAQSRAEAPRAKTRLSYKEKVEFEALPARIDALETERAGLEAKVAGPEFYREPADVIRSTLARLEHLPAELDAVYRRWDELDSRAK